MDRSMYRLTYNNLREKQTIHFTVYNAYTLQPVNKNKKKMK
jgi:hypothetical protein